MAHDTCAWQPARRPNFRQRMIRRRARHMSLATAVYFAVQASFCFTHRAAKAQALWSHSEHVWLGRETFLHWACCDRGIDIPWVVEHSIDAPAVVEPLSAAVRKELTAYWERQLHVLPRADQPSWLPLP